MAFVAISTILNFLSLKIVIQSKNLKDEKQQYISESSFYDKYDPNFLDYFEESKIRERKPYSSFLKGPLMDSCSKSDNLHTQLSNNSTQCEQYKLPLNGFSRIEDECLPRIVLLPSHPVSGNGLTRNLFENITSLVSTKLFRFGNKPKGDTLFFRVERMSWDIYGSKDQVCIKGGKVPSQGRVALTKTHYPGHKKNAFNELHPSFINGISQKYVSHVVRLVRNPGDHMIRQIMKWNKIFDKNKCEKILTGKMFEWKFFHTFWSKTYDPLKPRMILHYEVLSDKSKAVIAMRELLDFIGETESEVGTLEAKVHDIVKEPSYEQGTLLTEYCGIATARKVHEYTETITAEMGYRFNFETGNWFLDL